jgi:hypothetical protein
MSLSQCHPTAHQTLKTREHQPLTPYVKRLKAANITTSSLTSKGSISPFPHHNWSTPLERPIRLLGQELAAIIQLTDTFATEHTVPMIIICFLPDSSHWKPVSSALYLTSGRSQPKLHRGHHLRVDNPRTSSTNPSSYICGISAWQTRIRVRNDIAETGGAETLACSRMVLKAAIDQPGNILLVSFLSFVRAHSNPAVPQSGNIALALQDNAVKYLSMDMCMAQN